LSGSRPGPGRAARLRSVCTALLPSAAAVAWSGGQQWLVSWHPPPDPPDGTPHGAEGVCVTADGDIS